MDIKNKLALLSSVSADELDERGRTGQVVLVDEIRASDARQLPALPGGWKAKYVGMNRPDSVGRLIMLPDAEWTRKLWREGQYVLALHCGMTRAQTRVWMASVVRGKHDERIMSRLGVVLNDPDLITKYRAYELRGSYNNYLRWMARTGINDGFTASERCTLVGLMEEILTGVARDEVRREEDAKRKLAEEETRRIEAIRDRKRTKKQAKFQAWLGRKRAAEAAAGIVSDQVEGQLVMIPELAVQTVEIPDEVLDAVIQGNA